MVPMYHIDGVKGDASSTFQGRVRAGALYNLKSVGTEFQEMKYTVKPV